MKNVVLATAAVLGLSTAATAAELGAGFSINNTTTAEVNIDKEAFTLTSEPSIAYDAYGIAILSVGSELTIIEDEEFALDDELPTLDFRVEGDVYGATVYGEIDYNLETELRGDAIVGVSMTF